MEIVIVVVVVILGLWWAFSAKRASQGALRYQIHKDALAEAKQLVETADEWRPSVPLEQRATVAMFLENLEGHVNDTPVAQLGSATLLRDLLEDTELVRRAAKGAYVSEKARQEARARFMDELFEALDENLNEYNPKFRPLGLRVMSIQLRQGLEALAWQVPGTRVSLKKAHKLVHRAEELLRQERYEDDDDDDED